MLGVNLKTNLDEIMSDIGAFSAEEQRKAAARALNDAARGAITDAAKKIKERYPKLKSGEIKDAFSIAFASADVLEATVRVRGKPLTLTRFATQVVTKRGKGGVWVDVKGARKFFPHAWIATLKNKAGGEYQVLMARVGAERLPIEVFHTIDIPGAFKLAPIFEYVEAQSSLRFEKALTRSLNYALGSR